MSVNYEAAILINIKEIDLCTGMNTLSAQSISPVNVKYYPRSEKEGAFGTGLLLIEAIKNCETDYLLVLDGRACPVGEDFSEKLLQRLQDNPELSAVYGRMYGKKSVRSLNRAMDSEWLTERESFSLRDFYELGPEVFMMPMIACMLRVSDVKGYFIEPRGLARPEYELNALLLYDGKQIAKADASVDFAPGLSFVRCFRESFRFGAALKLYYTSFGLSWKNTAIRMDTDITKHARRTLKKVLKAGAVWAVPAVPVRMLAALLGDFLGENYHRLPIKLDRMLSADPYFS